MQYNKEHKKSQDWLSVSDSTRRNQSSIAANLYFTTFLNDVLTRKIHESRVYIPSYGSPKLCMLFWRVL